MRVAFHDPYQQLGLLAFRDDLQHFAQTVFGRRCDLCTPLGSGPHQVRSDAEKIYKTLECAGQWTDARQRLDFVIGDQLFLHRRQPQKIKQPQIA